MEAIGRLVAHGNAGSVSGFVQPAVPGRRTTSPDRYVAARPIGSQNSPSVSPVIPCAMTVVTVRDLRNHGGDVLDRVSRGEAVVVTRDGVPIAELRPVRRRGLTASELIARRRNLPRLDPEALRRDLDSVLDPSL